MFILYRAFVRKRNGFFSILLRYPFNMKIVEDHIHERQTGLLCIHFFSSQVDLNYTRFFMDVKLSILRKRY